MSSGPWSKSVSLPNKRTMQICGLNVDMYLCVCKCVRNINCNFFVNWLDLIVIVNMT